jgi:hypothetical protein
MLIASMLLGAAFAVFMSFFSVFRAFRLPNAKKSGLGSMLAASLRGKLRFCAATVQASVKWIRVLLPLVCKWVRTVSTLDSMEGDPWYSFGSYSIGAIFHFSLLPHM